MVNQVQKSLKNLPKLKNIFLYVCLAISLFINANLFAAEPIVVTVSSSNITMRETVKINFTFSDQNIEGFNFPRNTPDYEVVASSSSTSVQVINGAMSQNKTYSYVLKPLHEGELTIPSITVTIASQPYQTQPTTVNVTKAPSVQAKPPQTPHNSAPHNSAPSRQARPARATNAKDIFVKNTLTNYSPYTNQQFVVKTKVFHRGNLRGLKLGALQIDHMNIKRIDEAKEYVEEHEGLEYMVYEVDYIVFPLKSGKITIPEYDVKAIIMQERGLGAYPRLDPLGFMTNFFEEKEMIIKAPALTLNVRELPAGAPAGFSGYVGSLAVTHQANKLEINSGDPVTIKTNVYGNGNPKNLDFEFFEKSQLYSIYKDKENLRKEINKGYEYYGFNSSSAIIPERKSGRITIKTKPLISFNPYSKKYEKHGEENFEILVRASAGTSEEEENGQALAAKENKAPKKEEFKKEMSLFSVSEILEYSSWKDFDPEYLIIALILLNIAYTIRYTSRRVNFKDEVETLDYSALTKQIKKATELEEISSVIKDLEKTPDINPELQNKFNDFTSETDRYNYGFAKEFNQEKLGELKNRAIELIKELKVNA